MLHSTHRASAEVTAATCWQMCCLFLEPYRRDIYCILPLPSVTATICHAFTFCLTSSSHPLRWLCCVCHQLKNTMVNIALNCFSPACWCAHGKYAQKLLKDLFTNYTSALRPVEDTNTILNVTLQVTLSQIIDMVNSHSAHKWHSDSHVCNVGIWYFLLSYL